MCKKFLFYSRKSRQSRQKFRAIFREIREIITLVFSSDAARNVPTPLLIAQGSRLIAQNSSSKLGISLT